MLDHRPGKGNPQATHADAATGPGPGKRSRVEQAQGSQGHGGPVAKAADTPVLATFSTDYASFHQGNVFIRDGKRQTVTATHGAPRGKR